MTFPSYAQNLEDVLLHRALSDVESGFYIDVGAADPEIDSVTKAFYDLGWKGINVEPSPAFAERLAVARPRDINLAVAASDQIGSVAFHRVVGYGELSTTVSEIAEEYEANGRLIESITVPSRTLADICRAYASGEIHFLKVDVEGAEAEVLSGADFTAFRPWIVVVESVRFGRDHDTTTDTSWASVLTSADYEEVYFDGLNKFFVAGERSESLKAAFEVPVNVRDDYARASRTRSEYALDRLAAIVGLDVYSDEHEVLERTQALLDDRVTFEKRALAAEARVRASLIEAEASRQSLFERERYVAWLTVALESARSSAREQAGQIGQAEQRLAQVLRSTSWRLTTPLRFVRRPRAYLIAMKHRRQARR